MVTYKVLVFPCGSEIGLEIYRSLRYSIHVELFGGSSVNDHGKFMYEKYIGNIPDIDSPNIIQHLKHLVKKWGFDAIYPTMDKVIWMLKSNEEDIGCKIITSSLEATNVCLSKRKTYTLFSKHLLIPKVFENIHEISNFPVFVKPDIGYGSKGVSIINNKDGLLFFLKDHNINNLIITEYLPGDEYTVDCFTNRKGNLLFCGPRKRQRIKNGISVNTKPIKGNLKEYRDIAKIINQKLKLQGAWFFQLKRNINNKLVLLEIASRLGGSSSLYRGKGVNFALLSLYDAMGLDVEICINNYDIEEDRALDNKYRLNITYSTIYVDFDDCLIINDKLNIQLISFLYSAVNRNKKIILLTKHKKNIQDSIKKFRIKSLFDEILHIEPTASKADYITDINSIFIDDSFAERKSVKIKKNIHVFSPDMVEIL